jgi:hypothetical protein
MQTFRRNILSPSSGLKMALDGAKTKRIIIIIIIILTAVETSSHKIITVYEYFIILEYASFKINMST